MNSKKVMVICLACSLALSNSVYAMGRNMNIENTNSFYYLSNYDATGENNIGDVKDKVDANNIILDSSSTNYIEQGQQFKVELEENISTGYSWDYIIDNDGIELVNEESIQENNAPGIVGAPYKKVWTFKANSSGSYNMSFSKARPWEKDVAPIESVEYVIDVE